MSANLPSIDPMTTWPQYVRDVAKNETNSAIAKRIGITGASVGRWFQGSLPDPGKAAEFARSYGRPVLEAFVAAGYLSGDEAGELPTAPPTLATLDDDELLEEVRRRMQGGSDVGSTEAQKSGAGSIGYDRTKAGRCGLCP